MTARAAPRDPPFATDCPACGGRAQIESQRNEPATAATPHVVTRRYSCLDCPHLWSVAAEVDEREP